MVTIIEGGLEFQFPDGWDASQFDKWTFYRGQFAQLGNAEILCTRKGCDGVARCDKCRTRRIAGNRGIDILAIGPELTCWLIEIKDYRSTLKSDLRFLADVVALKVRDTLACLVPARLHASEEVQRDRASKALSCPNFRVLLHLEPPPTHRRLHAPTSQQANVLQRLKQLVKAIDSRPLVVSMDDADRFAWSVRDLPRPRPAPPPAKVKRP